MLSKTGMSQESEGSVEALFSQNIVNMTINGVCWFGIL